MKYNRNATEMCNLCQESYILKKLNCILANILRKMINKYKAKSGTDLGFCKCYYVSLIKDSAKHMHFEIKYMDFAYFTSAGYSM